MDNDITRELIRQNKALKKTIQLITTYCDEQQSISDKIIQTGGVAGSKWAYAKAQGDISTHILNLIHENQRITPLLIALLIKKIRTL